MFRGHTNILTKATSNGRNANSFGSEIITIEIVENPTMILYNNCHSQFKNRYEFHFLHYATRSLSGANEPTEDGYSCLRPFCHNIKS